MSRARLLIFGAVLAATAVLAVLGWVSLRQWQASAELLFREQSRDMATMAAEKVEMAVLKAEEECLSSLQMILVDPVLRPEALDEWRRRNPIFDRLTVVDRQDRVLYPAGEAPPGLVREIPESLWDRGGRRHLLVGDHVVLAAVIPGASGPVLAVLGRNVEAVKRDVLAKTLGGLEGPSVLAVLDARGDLLYVSRPIDQADRVLTVAFGEALPTWRVALYQPPGISSRGDVRRQAMLFMAAFALLLLVITLGLVATYRLLRRETEMARLKSDFVANVSHDLKTPLSLIRMFGETLELGRVPDEATRLQYYAVITRESERLTRLIDNVLDFSRIEGGRQRYDIGAHPVEPLIHEVLDAFRYPLAQRDFKLDVTVAPDLPDVLVDPEAIKQALANLVDNALKYSTDRRRLALEARGEGRWVVIEVADEGIGIPTAELERIFEKFYRIGRSETQGTRGSGVGLALVKHIAEAHGGRVTAESRPGQGSRFSLWLPVASTPSPLGGEGQG
ncbi:MAG TPA: HAMP domain-containing sensor histidine kinase [Candidatus Bathyarchaeia archaeon]|nr:HAMP domain-containing sensor histidine kinase [Candidatus Bathyarchaeia archaeon]